MAPLERRERERVIVALLKDTYRLKVSYNNYDYVVVAEMCSSMCMLDDGWLSVKAGSVCRP